MKLAGKTDVGRSSEKALPLLKKQPLLPRLCSGSAWASTLS